MIHALDHVDLVVKDLDAAAEQYTALLGRKPVWLAEANGVKHVWFQLGNMGLNIMSPTGPGVTGDTVRTRLNSVGEGIYALAFAVRDLAAAAKLIERRGIPASPPSPIRATDPKTGEKRYWNTSVLASTATAGTQIFLTERNEASPPFPMSEPVGDERAAVNELDHVIIRTPNPDRAIAIYGGRLGLDLRLDRPNPQLGNRLMFFKVGGAIVEIGAPLRVASTEGIDKFGGFAWRVRNPEMVNARLAQAGRNVSEVRQGRKPGTAIFTVRDGTVGVPTVMIEQGVTEDA